jgi:hypothetical protein
MTASFDHLVRQCDPDYRRAEAIALNITDDLDADYTDDHQIVLISALAHILIAFMRQCPAQYRTVLTDSLLADLRQQILDPDA